MNQVSFIKIVIWPRLLKTFKIFLVTLGLGALAMIVLSFTPLPYKANHWLGTYKSECYFEPGYIVMFGGSGMPSGDNLIRLYYTAQIANKYGNCKIIIAHPLDSDVYADMINELIVRKIELARIYFEKYGTNTRSQVLCLAKDFPHIKNVGIVIVTSPDHVLRSVLAFRKLGFKKICGCPAFESDMNIDLSYNAKKIGGRKYIPDIGGNLGIRYNFWNYLKLEITCLREYTALFYYLLNDWI
jgi:uncharacterized SAM-binding protein YcdF (DUF218 family)